eukprot:8783493-Pyramimonas_sp.AAC.1
MRTRTRTSGRSSSSRWREAQLGPNSYFYEFYHGGTAPCPGGGRRGLQRECFYSSASQVGFSPPWLSISGCSEPSCLA